MARRRWTQEACLRSSKKYKTLGGWIRGEPVAYAASKRQGWFEECSGHLKRKHKPAGYWTKARLVQEAKKYKNRSEFRRLAPSAYLSASVKGYLYETCKHMRRLGNLFVRGLYVFEYPDRSVYVGLTCDYDRRYREHMAQNRLLIRKSRLGGQVFTPLNKFYPAHIAAEKESKLIEKYRRAGWSILNRASAGSLGGSYVKWTREACLAEGRKHATKSKWTLESPSSITIAYRRGWIEECSAHMKRTRKPHGYWNRDRCLKEAKKYKSVRAWYRGSPSSYTLACKNGWYRNIVIDLGLKRQNSRWSKTLCIEEAKKHATSVDWRKESRRCYETARRNGWLQICKRAILKADKV